MRVVHVYDASSGGCAGFWLVYDYLPEVLKLDRQILPTMTNHQALADPIKVQVIPIAHDCMDEFLGAFCRRPDAYLDDHVRRGISTFGTLCGVDAGIKKLLPELDDATWMRGDCELSRQSERDIGYRLVLSGRLAAA